MSLHEGHLKLVPIENSLKAICCDFSFVKPKWPFYFPLSALVFKCSLNLTDAHTIQEALENSKCVVTTMRLNSLKQHSEVILVLLFMKYISNLLTD